MQVLLSTKPVFNHKTSTGEIKYISKCLDRVQLSLQVWPEDKRQKKTQQFINILSNACQSTLAIIATIGELHYTSEDVISILYDNNLLNYSRYLFHV